MKHLRIICLLTFFTLALQGSSSYLYASTIEDRIPDRLQLDTTVESVLLKEYAYRYIDTTKNKGIDGAISANWQRCNKVSLFNPSNNVNWIKYNIANNYDIDIVKVLFIPYHHLHKVDVYLQTDNNVQLLASLGIKRDFSNKEKKIIGYPITINFQANVNSILYLKYDHLYRPVRATAYLLSEEKLEKVSIRSSSLLWFWRGIYVFAMLISMLVFVFTRIRSFLYYFMFNLGVSLFMISHIGDYFMLFSSDPTDISSVIDYIGAFFINLFFPLFINGFTPLKENNRKMWKLMCFFIYGMIPFVILSFFPFVRQSAFTLIIHNYIMIVSGLVFILQLFFLIKNIYYRKRNAIPLTIIYGVYISTVFLDIILPNVAVFSDSAFVYQNLIFGSFFEVFSFMFMMAKETLIIYKHRAQLIEKQKKHQKEIIFTMVNSQEEERNRTGRELHDLIGANMAIIKQRVSYDSELSTIVSKTLEDVRSLSHGLVTPMVNNDEFIDEIKQMAYLCSTKSMEVHVYFHKWPMIRNSKITTHIYRICQELLQNATKHSNATNVFFQFIGQEEDNVSIYYEDDGIGFDCKKQIKSGLGLRNIKDRVYMLDGEIVIESELNKGGTTISIEI